MDMAGERSGHPVRVCLVGKYPPIQGGVSAQTFWAARCLAERGHRVHVVTNAAEVEDAYRIRLERADLRYLSREFDNGGAVVPHQTDRVDRRSSHIPMANPFVSKLAGLATRVVRAFDCQVVVGSYFEPYGMAASLAAAWTGVPVLLQHAGSDLDRLMRLPDLAAAYREMLLGAAGVVTAPHLFGRFLGLGVRPEALRTCPPYAIPDGFTPDAAPLTPEEIDRLAYRPPDATRPARPFDPRLPTIGMYGKPAVVKGTYDLIAALGLVRESEPDFNLLLLTGPSQRDRMAAAIEAAGLTDQTRMLTFLPHWRMPAFLRACTAVCFLERDFPVAIHGPVVPHEVLACGVCLVLSGEIHQKQVFRNRLVDGENMVLVADPKDRAALAKQLRALIERPATAAAIGAAGHLVAAGFPRLGQFADAWEALVRSVAQPQVAPAAATGGPSRADGALADPRSAPATWARRLLGTSFDEFAGRFESSRLEPTDSDPRRVEPTGSDQGRVEPTGSDQGRCAPALDGAAGDATGGLSLARRFNDFLVAETTGACRDAARYQRARWWATLDGRDEDPPPPVSDPGAGLPPAAEGCGEMYPYRAVPLRIERFDHDVTPLFCQSGPPGVTDPPALPGRPTLICFARLANLAPTELRLNDTTALLIARCTGGRTLDRILADMAAELADGRQPPPEAVAERALAAVRSLQALGVLAMAATPVSAAALIDGR